MAKRKLTLRQSRIAQKQQQQHLQDLGSADPGRANSKPADGIEGIIVARFGARLDVEAPDRMIYRCTTRQNLPELVCGDRVVFQTGGPGKGVVVALIPRRTELVRPGHGGQLKLVAANIDQIIIVTTPNPELDLINRYLVAAETHDIQPLIFINKIDLLAKGAHTALQARMTNYQRIGYSLNYVSSKTTEGLAAAVEALKHHTSIFVGHSGVGKSSLIKALLPDVEIRIGELSSASGLGKHTTTTAVLYHFPGGGDLIDSPGVREFGLEHVEPADLARGFIEFRDFLQDCKYNNCQHLVEPKCGVRAAVQRGDIDAERYASYCRALATPH